jgi:hypothetical protein
MVQAVTEAGADVSGDNIHAEMAVPRDEAVACCTSCSTVFSAEQLPLEAERDMEDTVITLLDSITHSGDDTVSARVGELQPSIAAALGGCHWTAAAMVRA